MSAKRFGRLHKATALVPLAVLSAAWTVNATGLGATLVASPAGASAPTSDRGALPDGTPLPPAIGLNHPASVSGPQAQQISPTQATRLVDASTVSGIPAVALAAYQRAATVLNNADTSCNIPWQLVAAIGRVESDDGRADGNTLTSKGISTPGIFGPVLNGKHGTTLIKDTDGGTLDGDTRFDRAVGPMQFIPSTWSIVAVDGDGDGKRNPQDINDAALATAVYLCAGPGDLSTTAGARKAVYRFNHSWSYVRTVLAVERAYLAGDFTSVPNDTLVPTTPVVQPVDVNRPRKHHTSTPAVPDPTTAPSAPQTTSPSRPTTGTKKTTPTKPPASSQPAPTSGPSASPTPSPSPTQPVQATLTAAQALTECETQVLGTTLQTALGATLGGNLTQVVAALNDLPLLGGPAAATKLQDCVTTTMND